MTSPTTSPTAASTCTRSTVIRTRRSSPRITAVKGLGRWSAEMFLMFRLNRPDILPVGDLGIVKGMQTLFGMKRRPAERTMVQAGRRMAAVPLDRLVVRVESIGYGSGFHRFCASCYVWSRHGVFRHAWYLPAGTF